MNYRYIFPLLCGLLLLFLPARSYSAPKQPFLPAEAAEVAEDFLGAFVKNDRKAIRKLLPKTPANLYGPSPFSRMPLLSKPRARERQGAIDFKGGRAETTLPNKGVMVLRKMKEDGGTIWRVRQIYWYDTLPPEARQIPNESVTAADRKQEPAIRKAVQNFLHHWMQNDFKQVDQNVFHWWEVDRKPPKWVKMKKVDLKAPVNSLGGMKVDFVANLRFIGLVPKSVKGNLWLVQEEGIWRVRPLTVAFWF